MPPNKPEESAQNVIDKPMVDYDHFINDFSKLRQPSVIRELSKLYSQKGSEVISLAGGLPNPTTFPFEEISIQLTDGSSICLKGKELLDALQYIPTQGYPPLLGKLSELQWKVHRPPCWQNCKILVTPGSQDGLCKAIEMSLEKGEPIIVQHPVYSGTECLLRPFQADTIPVEQDENGMIPELLQEALEKRLKPEEAFTSKKGIPKDLIPVRGEELINEEKASAVGGDRVEDQQHEHQTGNIKQLMYVNTTGANPTGVALTTERKKEIYRLACKYNLIILEDDPYYYLHFQDEYPTSFLSLDTEGRVLRFDSFSKIMSPGLRLGFVTGPKELVDKIELHVQAASLHATSLSQVIIYSMFEKWGFSGMFKHFEFIQNYYKTKRDMMINAAKKHLTGLAEWNEPTAGMFLWIKVLGLSDVQNLVTKECINKGVMLVTGHAYIVHRGAPCQYLRACYSLATEEQIDVGMKRLAEAIREEIQKQT